MNGLAEASEKPSNRTVVFLSWSSLTSLATKVAFVPGVSAEMSRVMVWPLVVVPRPRASPSPSVTLKKVLRSAPMG